VDLGKIGVHTINISGWVIVQDTADDPHHHRHPRSANEKRISTTELVNSDDQEETSSADLDGSINTSCKQGGVGLGDTDGLEDLGCVVSNGVRSRELLAQEDREGNGKSVSVSWDQDFLPRYAFGQVQFFLDGGADIGDFLQDLWVVDLIATHVCEGGSCFLVASLLDQPSWRFFQEEQTNEEQAARNELKSNLERKYQYNLIEKCQPVGRGVYSQEYAIVMWMA